MCSHHIVDDYIDIDPDKSQQIFYCELCQTTFDKDSMIYDKEKGEWIYAGDPPTTLEDPEILPPRV